MSAPGQEELIAAAAGLLEACRARGLTLATAESCTGGLIAAALTEVAGSSDVFDRGFVTYSNQAKIEMLGIPAELIAEHGAVSREVAEAMAKGALAASQADIAVAVTGIAGPGGGSALKPVGLVHLCAAGRNGRLFHLEQRYGETGRAEIRRAAVLDGIRLVNRIV
jgi:nicotinamide-nucleotide amidase